MSREDLKKEIQLDALSAYENLPAEFCDDLELARLAVEKDPRCYYYISGELAKDKELLLGACRNWRTDYWFWKEYYDGLSCFFPLFRADDSLKDSEEIVLEAVEYFPWAILGASERLLGDKSFVSRFITDDHEEGVINYISRQLQRDPDILRLYVFHHISKTTPYEIDVFIEDMMNGLSFWSVDVTDRNRISSFISLHAEIILGEDDLFTEAFTKEYCDTLIDHLERIPNINIRPMAAAAFENARKNASGKLKNASS